MNVKMNLGSPNPIAIFTAAALAAAITIGMLSATVGLFQSRGAPLERLVAAERACALHAYQSEREACMKQWLAESRGISVARE